MEIERAIRSALADEIGRDRYDVWFGDRVRLEVEGRVLRVTAPNQFSLDRLRKDFSEKLGVLSRRFVGSAAAVQYGLEQPAEASSGAAGPSPCSLSVVPSDAIVASRRGRPGPSRPAKPPRDSQAGRDPQHSSPLDSFVVSQGTQLAHTSAKIVVERPGQFNPLFVFGPSGCGKTHLLEGIRRASTARLRRIVMLSAEQFTSEFLAALQGSGLPSFRRRYRDVEMLLLDDVHFFAGKRATLVELQSTIDSLQRQRRQIVLSADRSPAELNGLGQELVNRMSGGMVTPMEHPDAPARGQILRAACQRVGLTVDREVIDYLAGELTGDARQLQGAIHRLLASSEALGCPVTIDLTRSALADMLRATCRAVRLSDIESAVCEVFGLDPQELHSGRRTRSVSQPRMLAMWLARKHTRAAYSEIGHFFGGRSHSTVISASKKVNRWVSDGSPIQVAHGECPIDDAIRRVETKLRA